MKRRAQCGKTTRTVAPVMVKPAVPVSEAMADNRPLPRLALQALGWPEPAWGEHPDDNSFEDRCEACAETG